MYTMNCSYLISANGEKKKKKEEKSRKKQLTQIGTGPKEVNVCCRKLLRKLRRCLRTMWWQKSTTTANEWTCNNPTPKLETFMWFGFCFSLSSFSLFCLCFYLSLWWKLFFALIFHLQFAVLALNRSILCLCTCADTFIQFVFVTELVAHHTVC